MIYEFAKVQTVCDPYIYCILRKSPRSSHSKLIVVVHFTYTIDLNTLLCEELCGTVQYIENSRVRTIPVCIWKGSLMFDVIYDLPY